MLLEVPTPPTTGSKRETGQLSPAKSGYTIYSDGACSGNPGPGGWGVLVEGDSQPEELFDGSPQTTNNQMELTAAINGLEATPEGADIQLYTDSRYVIDGITKWISGWKKNGWKTSSAQPVKNGDLWKQLDSLNSARNVTWKWVKGHAGNPGNERADQLANDGMSKFKS